LPSGALATYWQKGLAWDSAGERLAISWAGGRASSNVFVWDGGLRRLTDAGALGIEADDLVEPEHVTYPTFDGRQIPALFFPSPSRTGACVVVVHGGPEGQSRPTLQPVIQLMLAAGFSVLAPTVLG